MDYKYADENFHRGGNIYQVVKDIRKNIINIF